MRSCSVLIYSDFVSRARTNVHSAREICWFCLTQGYSNLLQELFFYDFFISIENIYNKVGPEQQKKIVSFAEEWKSRRKEQTSLHLVLKFDFKFKENS